MNKKATTIAATLLVASGLIYMWSNRHQPESAADPADPVPSSPAKMMLEPSPASNVLPAPRIVDEAGAPESPPSPFKDTRPVTSLAGTHTVTPSIELRTHLLLLGLGGGTAHPQGIQALFGLTEEELAQLTEQAKITLAQNIEDNVAGQAEVCAARNTYLSIEQFGKAVNEYTRKGDEKQEALGREARQKLDRELVAKLDAGFLNQPPVQKVVIDFPVFLSSQNRDLQTGIERFCSAGKRK